MKLLAITIAALMLAGCSGHRDARSSPPANAAPEATASTVVVDTARQACHQMTVALKDDAESPLGPEAWRPVAQAAEKADDTAVAAAGELLLSQVAASAQVPDSERGDAVLGLRAAIRRVAAACGDLYGDGPW